MKTLVRFVTPAFLGNAEQAGHWRTPPFKALLRQWWRVAEARGDKPVISDLRRREGELFGRAADESTTASQVKLRMDWRGGTAPKERWKKLNPVIHPEVAHRAGADLYLGYGPVDVGSKLKRDTFIPAGEGRALTISIPPTEEEGFEAVFKLAHTFGALGSRCRNGWGSLHFEQGGLSGQELAALFDPAEPAGRDWLRAFSRDWRRALDTDWCHALGQDENGLLLWRTEDKERWEEVLEILAAVKIAFRAQFHFQGSGPHTNLCDRQLLAYPVTKHSLNSRDWERNANQVLFKVLPLNGRYVGLIAHTPHRLPSLLHDGTNLNDAGLRARENQVWSRLHEVLDWQSAAKVRIRKISDDKSLPGFFAQSDKALSQLTRLP